MTFGRQVSLLVVLALLPGAALAGGVELTPFAGYRIGGELEAAASLASEFEDDFSFGFVIDFPIGYGAAVELLYSRQGTELRTKADVFTSPRVIEVDVEYFHVGGVWEWGPWKTRPFRREKAKQPLERLFFRPRLRPFATVSAGLAEWNPDEFPLDSKSLVSFSLGGGAKYLFVPRVGVRFEGRVFGSFIDGDRGMFCTPEECLGRVSGSFLWQFEGSVGLIIRI